MALTPLEQNVILERYLGNNPKHLPSVGWFVELPTFVGDNKRRKADRRNLYDFTSDLNACHLVELHMIKTNYRMYTEVYIRYYLDCVSNQHSADAQTRCKMLLKTLSCWRD